MRLEDLQRQVGALRRCLDLAAGRPGTRGSGSEQSGRARKWLAGFRENATKTAPAKLKHKIGRDPKRRFGKMKKRRKGTGLHLRICRWQNVSLACRKSCNTIHERPKLCIAYDLPLDELSQKKNVKWANTGNLGPVSKAKVVRSTSQSSKLGAWFPTVSEPDSCQS